VHTIFRPVPKRDVILLFAGFLQHGMCVLKKLFIIIIIITATTTTIIILILYIYKKLRYRRVTARCILSVVILPTATQQCRNYLYDKS